MVASSDDIRFGCEYQGSLPWISQIKAVHVLLMAPLTRTPGVQAWAPKGPATPCHRPPLQIRSSSRPRFKFCFCAVLAYRPPVSIEPHLICRLGSEHFIMWRPFPILFHTLATARTSALRPLARRHLHSALPLRPISLRQPITLPLGKGSAQGYRKYATYVP